MYMYFTCISLFDSLLSPFTRHFCSLNLLFPLLVFVITSQSRSSHHSICVLALLGLAISVIFASQSHAFCAFFLVLISCLALFPGPRPASRCLQYGSFNCTASDGKLGEGLGLAVYTRKLARGGCEGGDSRGWSEHLRVGTYVLAGHTLARVTLPVTCTVVISGRNQMHYSVMWFDGVSMFSASLQCV